MIPGGSHLFFTRLLPALVAWLCCQPYAYAQTTTANRYNPANIKAEQIGVNQGLSQGLISRCYQDADGYLWIGTADGLNRYDGSNFKIFRHDAGDTSSLTNNYVFDLLVDSHDRLWVTTSTGELDLFDRATESFIHVIRKPANMPEEVEYEAGRLSEDNRGNPVIHTASSGYKVVLTGNDLRQPFRLLNVTDVYPSLKFLHPQPTDLYELTFTKDGTIACTLNESVYVFAGKHPEPAHMVGTRISLAKGAEGIYIDSAHQAIQVFDAASNKFRTVYRVPAGAIIERPFVDHQNRLWLQQRPDGNIIRVTIATGKEDDITIDWQSVDANVSRIIDRKFEDRDGNVYIMHSGLGMVKLKERTELFHHYPDKKWTSSYLRRTITASDGRIFSEDIYNTWSKYLQQHTLNDQYTWQHVAGQPLIYDKQGCTWKFTFISQSGKEVRLIKIDPRSNTCTTTSKTITVAEERLAYPILLDKNDDLWYIDYRGKGNVWLQHIDTRTMKEEEFLMPISSIFTPNNFLSDWYQQADGVLWLATLQGIFSFDPQSGKFKHYANENGIVKALHQI